MLCLGEESEKVSNNATCCSATHMPAFGISLAGGPGIYVVLHCGTAGHNIRAQPTMKSNAIGRLKLGDTFKVKEEVRTCYNRDGSLINQLVLTHRITVNL